MAEQLPGRPCADVKNMYHSLVRSGKIARSDKPRRSKLQPVPLPPPPPLFERTRYTRSRPSSKRQKTEMSQWNNSNNIESKQFRKSGIPLVVAAPAFCSPNTRNAARVLMSLDASSSNNTTSTVNNSDPSQKPLNKENDDALSTPSEHFFCKVYSVSFEPKQQ